MTEFKLEKPGRTVAGELAAAMRGWEPPGGFGGQMHVGDVGWYLRFDEETVDAGLYVWRSDANRIVAVGLQHGAEVLLTAVAPDMLQDPGLGQAMLDDALTNLAGEALYVDAPYPAAVRVLLAGRGWDLDPDPWPVFYRPLIDVDRARIDPDVVAVNSDSLVASRVETQRAMFEGSQSDLASWRRMRKTPTYSEDLDMLLRQGDDFVAAATAWSAGPGRCGLLEPVGVHREHRGLGFGRRIVLAACAALARQGASGVAVFTSSSNASAVALYQACGFKKIGLAGSMRGTS